ncbi:MAG: ubiquinol-cytochrome c reductase iron-sulfur subunit [Gemmatimonadaceae bacterium]
MPCEESLSRREFLASAAGAAGLVAVAGCGDGFVSPLVTQAVLPPGPLTITVADFSQLATPGVLVRVPGEAVAVKRLDASSFEAFSMVCTHQGCLVGITNGQQFDCPCHFSRFNSDGAVVRGPATQPLPNLTTSYDPATDQLTIS